MSATSAAKNSFWIQGSAGKDILWLVLPGVMAGFLSRAFTATQTDSFLFLLYAFLALGVLDSGHVYVTLWRTYFDPQERKRSRVYFYAPVLLFGFFLCWQLLRIPYLGSFVVYATIFHNVRQFYGIQKWYQRLQGTYSRAADYFFYSLVLLPFLAAHFRGDYFWTGYYSDHDVFLYPSLALFRGACALYGVALFGWLFFEVRNWRREPSHARALAVATPAFLYAWSFLFGRSEAEILFPLVVSHGCAYIALTSLAVKRSGHFLRLGKIALPLILLTALFFGGGEFLLEDSLGISANFWWAAAFALYLTPLFCHYWFDAFLWQRSHPAAERLFSAQASGEI